MEYIPLLCKICPEEPHFSDVSHLLTHVSSKGHLYQCNLAELRSHNDVAFRHRLEAYKEWYEMYQIEHLLAQRIAQKDSKNAAGKGRPPRHRPSVPVKGEEPKTKAKRKPGKVQRAPNKPVSQDTREPIDPQLSLFIDPPDGFNWVGPSSPNHRPPTYSNSLRRTESSLSPSQAPAIRTQGTDADYIRRDAARTFPIKSDMDEASEIGPSYPPSPIKDLYPDPSTLGGRYNMIYVPHPMRSPHNSKVSTPSRASTTGQSPRLCGTNLTHFLQLKGPRYPGMALFDSASPNSQRLRNQKKEFSILAQMEHNADTVEPLEQIYFPEWTLKKERVITGNVESSPIQDASPKPKRRRAKQGRAVLGDLDTNVPVTKSSRQATSRPLRDQSSHVFGPEHRFIHKLPQTNLEPKSPQSRPTIINEEAEEWRLNMGLPEFASSRKFAVLRDDKSTKPRPSPQLSNQRRAPFDTTAFQSRRSPLPNESAAVGVSAPSSSKDANIRQSGPVAESKESSVKTAQDSLPEHHPIMTASSRTSPMENLQSLQDLAGQAMDQALSQGSRRVTQRYFAVTGNQPPHFFDALPAQMEFGGSSDHRFHGSPINPLNPQGWQPQRGSHFPIYQPLSNFEYSKVTFGPFRGTPKVESEGYEYQS